MEKVDCPKCLGTKQLMESKPTRGFNYPDCKLCDQNGKVPIEIHDDYILSLNEDNIAYYDVN